MGRLTIDIPDGAHRHLRVIAADRGVTIRDYVLERLMPDLEVRAVSEPSLAELAKNWEEARKDFRLERGGKSFSEIIHEGHKW